MSDTPEFHLRRSRRSCRNRLLTAADPSGKAVKWVVCVIVVSLIWYLLADRFTPLYRNNRRAFRLTSYPSPRKHRGE